jgi:tetratricopeptide (TPR) repeat protein
MGWVATVSNNLSEVLMPMGRFEESHRYLERSIQCAEMAERPRIEIDARRNLALLLGLEGKYEEAMAGIETARQLAKQLGQGRVTAAVGRSEGELCAGQARLLEDDVSKAKPHWVRAESAWRKAAQTFEKGGYILEAATTVGLLADALYELGKVEEAEKQRRRQAELKAASVDEDSLGS